MHPQPNAASMAVKKPPSQYVPDPRDDTDPLAPPAELREPAFTLLGESYDVRHRLLSELKAKLARYQRDADDGDVAQSNRARLPASVNFANNDDAFLLTFLRAKKLRVHDAFDTYVNYCKEYARNPWLREIDYDVLHTLFKTGAYRIMPRYDRQGRLILGMNCAKLIPIVEQLGRERVLEIVKAVFGILELIMADSRAQIYGLVIVADMSGYKLPIMSYLNIAQYQLSLNLCQNCYPIRASGMYMIHEPWYVRGLFSMLRPFMKARVKNAIKMHGDDVELIHRMVPPQSLTKNFGGCLDIEPSPDATAWAKTVEGLSKNLGESDKLVGSRRKPEGVPA